MFARFLFAVSAFAGQYSPHMYNNSDNGFGRPSNLPTWYPEGTSQLPVSYVGPSATKDSMARRQEIRQAAAITVRTDQITDEEVQYLKYMEDTSELAKFDKFVESFIDHKLSRGVLFWW